MTTLRLAKLTTLIGKGVFTSAEEAKVWAENNLLVDRAVLAVVAGAAATKSNHGWRDRPLNGKIYMRILP